MTRTLVSTRGPPDIKQVPAGGVLIPFTNRLFWGQVWAKTQTRRGHNLAKLDFGPCAGPGGVGW